MNPIFGKEARKKRRQEGTSVRNASWEELKSNLEQFKPDQEGSYFSAGEFRPIKREVVMFTDSPDVLEHEMTHAAQFGPLQRAALRAGMKDPGRAQDPEKRKAQKKILKSLTDEQWESMGKRGRYTLGSGKEYEAITTAGVNSLKRRFGEVGRDFESIKKQLYSIPESETNPNIRLLRDAVGGLSTEKQKDLFMKSIFSNLQS